MPKEIVGRGLTFPIQIGSQGGISLTTEVDEIMQAIRVILATTPGQRVMRPTFGSRLHELIFEPNDQETAALAARYAREALNMWEPRINLISVVGIPDDSHHMGSVLQLHIDFEIKATNDKRSLVYPFYLIPEED